MAVRLGGPGVPAGALGAVVGGGGVAVLAAWLLVHTLFTLRYAHVFYGSGSGHPAGGRRFPGDEAEPAVIDFAYFACVTGLTAQTADAGITTSGVRCPGPGHTRGSARPMGRSHPKGPWGSPAARAPGTSRMTPLATISTTAIDTVSDAKASPSARRNGTPARSTGRNVSR